ncbi:DnaT-like ssDNA-binding domain-containing protein [Endozoicomonas ascidiicola]|uniref:DnaT-like ssDNA-binding domain-containing protein n=1 Tax=Endozoicomonas ascidiicola TaxID=1698521 RepID=UPI000829D4C3|nr:DnaT-like ssDNA-binding domain-containing protein [Endozoicomonas ascidiicola]
MTDENRRNQRKLNAGMPTWMLNKQSEVHDEHPIFGQEEPKPAQREGARVQPLPEDFEPAREILEFLQAHQGIPLDFIATQLIDFKLYWHETGEARKAWQNKFKSHVIYQWKRNQSETGQRSRQSTAEKLTDRSWDDGFQFEDND